MEIIIEEALKNRYRQAVEYSEHQDLNGRVNSKQAGL